MDFFNWNSSALLKQTSRSGIRRLIWLKRNFWLRWWCRWQYPSNHKKYCWRWFDLPNRWSWLCWGRWRRLRRKISNKLPPRLQFFQFHRVKLQMGWHNCFVRRSWRNDKTGGSKSSNNNIWFPKLDLSFFCRNNK